MGKGPQGYVYERVYSAIKAFHAEHERCPRQFELAAIMKVSRTRAAQMYGRAVRLGQVTRLPDSAVYSLNPDWSPASHTTDFWSELRAALYVHSGGAAHLGSLSMLCNALKGKREWENAPDLYGEPESLDGLAKAVVADPVSFAREPNVGRKSHRLLVSWAEARLGLPQSAPVPQPRPIRMEDAMAIVYNASATPDNN